MSQKLSVFEDVVDGKYNMNWDPDEDFCKSKEQGKIPSCVGRGRSDSSYKYVRVKILFRIFIPTDR